MIDVTPWGATVVGRLGGGHRNDVFELRRRSERLVARATRRSPESLDWELHLMEFLSANGFTVPVTVPADDGRRHVAGVVVQTWLPGREPTSYDWPAVTRELTRLHALTAGWPQRPGFASTRALLTADAGGEVDLTAMPAEAVTACRAAWAALDGPHTVVHGDPQTANVRVGDAGVGLLDWDEARVDHPDLDLADLPDAELPFERNRVARAAVDAWEAAAGWRLEPGYARSRLAELTARADRSG
ncbi:phosphotransferase [Actinophytocola gossypii]|uniref:Phosphotransferase n=1 Tax=Actinophytocola gossypii TaxID=2812003 RepID=A0ABT2JKA1_9PSEU|nr:phosphotransferase [Actinophytocola gossypii]MCT2588308.1 phosphotransferase [Actinophytocola gossypii]